MHELSKVNVDYLKEHYREMMDVNDAPLPISFLGVIIPEMDELMAHKIKTEGRSSLYGKYNDNAFHHPGEDYGDEASRLLREFVKKHPEHSGLLS